MGSVRSVRNWQDSAGCTHVHCMLTIYRTPSIIKSPIDLPGVAGGHRQPIQLLADCCEIHRKSSRSVALNHSHESVFGRAHWVWALVDSAWDSVGFQMFSLGFAVCRMHRTAARAPTILKVAHRFLRRCLVSDPGLRYIRVRLRVITNLARLPLTAVSA